MVYARRLAGIAATNLPHQLLLYQSSLPPALGAVPCSSRAGPVDQGASALVMEIFPLACSATRHGESEMTDATMAPLHCSSAHLQAGREEDKGPRGLLQQ